MSRDEPCYTIESLPRHARRYETVLAGAPVDRAARVARKLDREGVRYRVLADRTGEIVAVGPPKEKAREAGRA